MGSGRRRRRYGALKARCWRKRGGRRARRDSGRWLRARIRHGCTGQHRHRRTVQPRRRYWKIFYFDAVAGQVYAVSGLSGITHGYVSTSPSVSPSAPLSRAWAGRHGVRRHEFSVGNRSCPGTNRQPPGPRRMLWAIGEELLRLSTGGLRRSESNPTQFSPTKPPCRWVWARLRLIL